MAKKSDDKTPQLEDLFPGLGSEKIERLSTQDAELFQRHFKGDNQARNEIVERYFGLVEVSVEGALKVIREAMEEGDLMQAGALGFVEAVAEYRDNKASQARPFEDFCATRIRTAVVKELIRCLGDEEDVE